MRKGLLRFCIIVIIVLLGVVAIDITIGKVMDRMLPKISNQGDTGKTYYSLNDVNTPVIIVGSSRAAHHYVTNMIEDSLRMSTYNVARDGCFFSYNCCVVNSIMDRYTPKLIIWENGTDYLYDGVPDPLESMYPYYGNNKWVKKIIKDELPWKEYVRLNSRMYQYNSIIHRVVMRYCGRNSFIESSEKGYQPLAAKKLIAPLKLEKELSIAKDLSRSKIAIFESTLNRAKKMGVLVIVVNSPVYKLTETNLSGIKMQQICEEYGMLYLDNSQLSYFHEHSNLFNDVAHMNDEGARIYTKMFLEQIKDYIKR